MRDTLQQLLEAMRYTPIERPMPLACTIYYRTYFCPQLNLALILN